MHKRVPLLMIAAATAPLALAQPAKAPAADFQTAV